jgi:hypothetical protein
MIVRACAGCGILWAEHSAQAQGKDAWKSDTVTPAFLAALAQRRDLQSAEILRRFGPQMRGQKLLDYGCGQGVFLQRLLDSGFDAFGADLAGVPSDRRVVLDAPWEIPIGLEAGTVILLDVLEHCANPIALIRGFRERGIEQFLVKVPLQEGPLFKMSRWRAQARSFGLIEKLFLVGDIAPHLAYFNISGMRAMFEREGYAFREGALLPEIGRELPARIRGESRLNMVALKPLVAAAGLGLEWASRLWSDTGVFLFRRQVG